MRTRPHAGFLSFGPASEIIPQAHRESGTRRERFRRRDESFTRFDRRRKCRRARRSAHLHIISLHFLMLFRKIHCELRLGIRGTWCLPPFKDGTFGLTSCARKILPKALPFNARTGAPTSKYKGRATRPPCSGDRMAHGDNEPWSTR
jgi:hypothetical protein